MGRTVVMTDSTAVLPALPDHAVEVQVVPLPVLIGGTVLKDGDEGTSPAHVVAALEAKVAVSTSRPAPAEFEGRFGALAEAGVSAVVAVHISGQMSGTFESARIAASRVTETTGLEIVVVDSRAVGPVLGFAAAAAAVALGAGASAEQAAVVAREQARVSRSLFYVNTLEYLRRGGRIGAAAALVGSALSIKPILTINDGLVVPKEKVRTSARALARLEELADEAVGEVSSEVVIAHLGAPERAAEVAQRLSERLGTRVAHPIRVAEVGAALGAHVGPGLIAACVSPVLA